MGKKKYRAWTQDHLVRIIATVAPTSDAAAEEFEAALAEWFTSCTPDSQSRRPQGYAAVSGGSALERFRADTTHIVTVLSGGEDGLDSARWEVDTLQELRDRVDPSAAISTIEQWRHEDEDAWHDAVHR